MRSVMAYYNEDPAAAEHTINEIVAHLPFGSSHYVRIYVKGDLKAVQNGDLAKVADEIIQLENAGREGETYLVRNPSGNRADLKNHIVRQYNTHLADFTIFVQVGDAGDQHS
jgi:hypothetical protein